MKNPDPNPEDEAFEELALKQGQWKYTSGWRKKQIQEPTWVGLTDDEHCDIWYKESLDWMEYGKAIEAKLKEKNT
jgi:hypothetical protein